jgi:acyl-CoA dehydrogenase
MNSRPASECSKSVPMPRDARTGIQVVDLMPQHSNPEVAGRIDAWWSIAKDDFLTDPFGQMAKAGLFQIGLPGAGADLETYSAIAAAEQAIAAKTGLLGLASAFAARQMTARFFIAGFADAAQRANWLPRVAAGQVCAAIAISEPGAGAHPKHLQTAAEPQREGFVVRGRKAWVTNGPIADVFLVLAVIAVEDERKRYGLFLIPRETPGLVVKPMPALDALAPASHCELELDGCQVPAAARVGDMPDAYPAMALPFRDVEDTVGTANISGMLSWLLEKSALRIERSEENALRLGRIAGLVSLVHAASRLAVAALDGEGQDEPARIIGVRLLARDIVGEIRGLLGQGQPADDTIVRALAAFDLLSSVAREPRKVRQIRLGNSIGSEKQ